MWGTSRELAFLQLGADVKLEKTKIIGGSIVPTVFFIKTGKIIFATIS